MNKKQFKEWMLSNVAAHKGWLRIGDPERDKTINGLSNAYSRGYLTIEEFNQRKEATFRAVYDDQLNFLTEDLPRESLADPAKPPPVRVILPPISRMRIVVSSIISFMVATGATCSAIALHDSISVYISIAGIFALYFIVLVATQK